MRAILQHGGLEPDCGEEMSTGILSRVLLCSVVPIAVIGCAILKPSFDRPLVEPHSVIETDSVPWTGLMPKDSDADLIS